MNVHGCLLNKQYMQEKHLIHKVHAMVQLIVVQYIRLHFFSQDFFCVSFVMFAQSTFCIFEHLAFVTTNNPMFDCRYQQVLLSCCKVLLVCSTLIQFLVNETLKQCLCSNPISSEAAICLSSNFDTWTGGFLGLFCQIRAKNGCQLHHICPSVCPNSTSRLPLERIS